MQQSVSDLQVKLQKENEEFSRQTVAKDLEIEKLLQQESKLRTELAKRRDELERFLSYVLFQQTFFDFSHISICSTYCNQSPILINVDETLDAYTIGTIHHI